MSVCVCVCVCVRALTHTCLLCACLRGGVWGVSILLRPLGRDKGSSSNLQGGLSQNKPRAYLVKLVREPTCLSTLRLDVVGLTLCTEWMDG